MAKKSKVIFRLTIEGKTPSTWQLPQTSVMGVKEGKGKKFINYYPGEDSCFVEDIEAKNKDLKPKQVPLFQFNSQSRETQLEVDPENYSLINYLKTHPWYGVKYKIFSKEEDAKNKLKEFEATEKALEKIKISDDNEIKACAMAVFTLNSFYKSVDECKAELKATAIKNPTKILEAFDQVDYDQRFIAGLALVSGIVKINPTQTGVVWADNGGTILHIAQGENGLDKLTKFLSQDNEQSQVMLQELNDRLERKQKAIDSEMLVDELSKKDAEIVALKKQLEEANKSKQPEFSEDITSKTEDEVKVNENINDKTLAELQEEYRNKFGKEPGPNFKNNIDKLKEKLAE